MQVDQFESEVESLSVQTRKKKGDKDVSGGGPSSAGCCPGLGTQKMGLARCLCGVGSPSQQWTLSSAQVAKHMGLKETGEWLGCRDPRKGGSWF